MKEPINMEEAQTLFTDSGVWMRPYGKLLYIMPSYVMTSEELSIVVEVMKKYAQLQSK